MPTNNTAFKIDGVTYKVHIIKMERKGDILDFTAKRLQNGGLKRDIIGTYYNFTLEIGIVNNQELYDQLWWVLTAPVASHQIQLPNQPEPFEGYFGSCKDNIELVTEDGYKAKGLSFNIVATWPARRPSRR